MARRAALFKKLRKQKSSVLALAGGFEFSRKNSQSLTFLTAKNLVQALDLLNYELGVLAPHESMLLQARETDLPSNWLIADSKSQSRIINVQGYKLGILVLPSLSMFKDQPGSDIYKIINQEARLLKSQVNILIGISLLGANLERQYLQDSSALFDILLGGGQGPGFAGKYKKNNQTLWVRPYDKGKSVNIIQISKWPQKNRTSDWDLFEQIKPGLAKLTDKYPEDSKMAAIFSQTK